jgi:serine/threonine protein kinase
MDPPWIPTPNTSTPEYKCLTLNVQTEFALKIMAVKRRESKELSLLKRLNHKNIVRLYYFYFSNHQIQDEETGTFSNEMCLNMFFELLPTTLFDELEIVGRFKEHEALFYLREILLGLVYLHSLEIVHRDIKPSNILVNPKTRIVKICDFGSAKVITADSGPCVSYICSRFYRAPELILGSDSYDDSVDMWSLGCVLGEMLCGQILFRGEETSMDQLVEIICILGQVSEYQLAEMNSVLPRLDDKILAPRLTTSTGHERLADRLMERMVGENKDEPVEFVSEEMFELITEMLQYIPYLRPTAGEILDRITMI